jgi:2-keto-4-pentenoate hydratase/2-oxohepta-3-ene-1,7-dioic acid hydratase in catechol pathway
MRFAPAALLAFLSRLMPLEAGGIISTGTPGAAVVTLGDVVECRISGLQPLIVHVSGRASSDRPPGAAGLAQDT